jgi:hypothetical protein
MSDLDLDRYRDPAPPAPDATTRAAVETRARRLRARRRARWSFGVAAAIVVGVAAIGVGTGTRHNGSSISVSPRPEPTTPTTATPTTATTPTTSRSSVVQGRFVPPVRTENGSTVMEITTPAGVHLTMHTRGFDVAHLGFEPGPVGIDYPVVTSPVLLCCSKTLTVRYATVAGVFGATKPIATYPAADGTPVPFFHTARSDELAFQFGPWLVLIDDVLTNQQFESRMTDDQRATYARSLTGNVDRHGYLELHAISPLNIATSYDLGFGSPDAGDSLEISDAYCGPPGSPTAAHQRTSGPGVPSVRWCQGNVLVLARGSKTFLDNVDHNLILTTG